MGHRNKTINKISGEEVQEAIDLLIKTRCIRTIRSTPTSITIMSRNESRVRSCRDYIPTNKKNRSNPKEKRKRRK